MPNTAPGLPNAQSFEVTNAGTVLDEVTGLIWQQTIDPEQLSFARAKEHCAQRRERQPLALWNCQSSAACKATLACSSSKG